MTSTIDESQRKAARVSGFFYLLTFAIVVAVNFGINEWFDTGLGLFELATGFWLVIKGLRPELTTADRARAGITS